MSSITWHGSIPEEDVPYEIEFDEFGIGSSTIHLQFRFGTPASAAARIANMTQHPAFSWLKRKKATISRQEADYAKASITYEGVPPNTDIRTYSLKTSTNTESIATHPDFSEWLADGIYQLDDKGKPVFVADPGTDAANTGGLVIGGLGETSSVGDANSDSFAGIESWLVPGAIYEEVWVRGHGAPSSDYTRLGKIDSPPPSAVLPTLRGRANWLYLGGNIDSVGYGTKGTRRWRASGSRGWHPRVYS